MNPSEYTPSQLVRAYNARFNTGYGLWEQTSGSLELMRIALERGKPVDLPIIIPPEGAQF